MSRKNRSMIGVGERPPDALPADGPEGPPRALDAQDEALNAALEQMAEAPLNVEIDGAGKTALATADRPQRSAPRFGRGVYLVTATYGDEGNREEIVLHSCASLRRAIKFVDASRMFTRRMFDRVRILRTKEHIPNG